MSIRLELSAGRPHLESLEASIRSAFSSGVTDVQEKLELPEVVVYVDDDADSTIPETGIGGFAPSANRLEIHIDPDSEGIGERLEIEFRSTLAHELHHCARWAACGYGETLLEEMVSEGLADHFDIEVNGGVPKPWSIALPKEQLDILEERARNESEDGTYDHDAWFFGSDEEGIPRWAGYALGYAIVEKYMTRSGRKASELVGESAVSFC